MRSFILIQPTASELGTSKSSGRIERNITKLFSCIQDDCIVNEISGTPTNFVSDTPSGRLETLRKQSGIAILG